MVHETLVLDSAYIIRAYVMDGRTESDIAAELGHSEGPIHRVLVSAGVEIRGCKLKLPSSRIICLYQIERKTAGEIACEFGCDARTIRKLLKDNGVTLRRDSSRIKLPVDYIIESYTIGKRSSIEIAHELNCNSETIRRRLKENNIILRSSEEAFHKWRHSKELSELTRSKVGPRSTNWRGGISYKPYCFKFNRVFKERIRDKFGRKCYLCPTTEKENGCKLDVHHIDYNKNSICNGHEWAFLPLCHKCHTKTNGKRWYWFNLLIYYWLEKYNLDFNSI